MALTIERLNDDTTFVLAFAPTFAPRKATRKFPGAFTIVVDPRLSGRASSVRPSVDKAAHATTPPPAPSWAALKAETDLIVISQDKPSHCHRETLCALPRDTSATILATPAAAKKIWSWRYFHPSVVQVMRPYSARKPETVVRIPLASYTSTSSPGEITIAHVPTKRDWTGQHYAVAITYRPPGSLLTVVGDETINLSDIIRPATASSKATPGLHKARSAIRLTDAARTAAAGPNRPRAASSPRAPPPPPEDPPEPVPPLPRSSTDSRASVTPLSFQHKEKTLSVLYTPHGLGLATLKPYLQEHLRPTICLPRVPDQLQPLTVLFHGLTKEDDPWFKGGGTISNGAPGGVLLAGQLKAMHWVSGHDDPQDRTAATGTPRTKSRPFSAEDVQAMLRKVAGGSKRVTALHRLRPGETVRIGG